MVGGCVCDVPVGWKVFVAVDATLSLEVAVVDFRGSTDEVGNTDEDCSADVD